MSKPSKSHTPNKKKKAALDPKQVFGVVARVLSGKSDILINVPVSHENPAATRGYHDRRGRGLHPIRLDTLNQTAPTHTKPQQGWLSFMDAFGEVKGDWEGLDGALQNARAARAEIFNNLWAVEGYDVAALIIAYDFFRSVVPDFDARLPDVAGRMTDALVQEAKEKSVFHMVMTERLNKDRDLIELVLDDPQALAHMVARLMEKPVEEQDKIEILSNFNALPERLEAAGYHSLKDLFDKRMALEQEYKKACDDLGTLTQRMGTLTQRKGKKKVFKRENEEQRRAIRKEKRNLSRKIRKNKSLEEQYLRHVKKLRRDSDFALESKNTTSNSTPSASTTSGLLPPSKDLRGFDYYPFPKTANDQYSQGRDLITREKAGEVLDGLYKTYATELRRANKIGRDLSRFMLAPRDVRLEFHLEEGVLNPSDLTRLIIDPTYDTPYMTRHETYGQSLDTTVTILVDNSGSMSQGNKIQLAYLSGERLSYWLQNAGVPTEVLGFTTNRSSTPDQEGIHHIVYKERHQPHTHRTTNEMAGMLSQNLLKNNCDGEAVSWAHNRLLTAPQKRKILLVISDGQPAANRNSSLLSRHLRDTVAWIEEASPVEIIGIGIKSDVGTFYLQSIRIETPYDLIKTMSAQIKRAIDKPWESKKRIHRKPVKLPEAGGANLPQKPKPPSPS